MEMAYSGANYDDEDDSMQMMEAEQTKSVMFGAFGK